MTQLVFIENERPVTDSLTIAEVFEKDHARVLRDIRELGCSEEFRLGNFAESHYFNYQGRIMPRYTMTEQGFTLLAMGYTGPKAMEFKERYIAEFTRMRTQQTQLIVVPSYAIDNPIERAERWIAEERERQALQLETQRRATLLLEQAPKITYYEQILRSPDALNVTQIASDYGISAFALNGILRDAGVQYRTGGQWVLRKAYADRGYTKSETFPIGEGRTRVYTKWTQKGRLFIHELLTQRGTIEAGGEGESRGRRQRNRQRKSSVTVTISLK